MTTLDEGVNAILAVHYPTFEIQLFSFKELFAVTTNVVRESYVSRVVFRKNLFRRTFPCNQRASGEVKSTKYFPQLLWSFFTVNVRGFCC